jgi:hypothetical protein
VSALQIRVPNAPRVVPDEPTAHPSKPSVVLGAPMDVSGDQCSDPPP